MSIADKITRLQDAKDGIADAITAKGGIVSVGDGFEDFASDIGSIPGGITPAGTIAITSNGTHDVTNYANANVNVAIPTYTGSYDVTPSATSNIVLETKDKKMTDNLTVRKIPYESVSNPQGGNTVTIGGY